MKGCLLFSLSDAKQESIGFSPAELVFGRHVRGSLKVLKEQLLAESSSKTNVQDFVSQCREHLHHASSLAKEALASSQVSVRKRYSNPPLRRRS